MVRPGEFRRIDHVVLALWIGVLAGFLEYAKNYLGGWSIHPMINLELESIWMQPAANALLFAAIGLGLAMVHWLVPGIVSQRLCVGCLIFLALLNTALMASRIHPIASVVFCAGLAKIITDVGFWRTSSRLSLIPRMTRWIMGLRRPAAADGHDHQDAYEVDRRRLLVSTALLVGVPAVGVSVRRRIASRRQVAVRNKTAKDKPNAVLLVLDTVRARSLSLYGYERPTSPNLSRIARRGVCFDWAISESPWTLPSHGSMFTGRHAHELSCDWHIPLSAKYPTLAEALSREGYTTAGFVANLGFCHRNFGLGRGFNHYEDFFLGLERFSQSSSLCRQIMGTSAFRQLTGSYDYYGRPSAAAINDRFFQWLDKNSNAPFFAFLNYFDPHAPYVPREPFGSRFAPHPARVSFKLRGDAETPDLKPGWISEQEIQAEQDAYDATIAYADHQLGRLCEELEARDLFDRTLLIIVGDHGEEFSEHGLMEHANSLYLPSVHVPLVMTMPDRIPSNTRVHRPVSLRDLARTVTEMLDLENVEFPGQSLSGEWSGSTRKAADSALFSSTRQLIRKPAWYPASQGDMYSVCVSGYRYIRTGNVKEELYDYLRDPLERHNLVDLVEGRVIAADCRRLLSARGIEV